jgi:hypothetical protein
MIAESDLCSRFGCGAGNLAWRRVDAKDQSWGSSTDELWEQIQGRESAS